MVNDRNVSLGCVVAYGCWALSIALLVLSFAASSLDPRTFITMQTTSIVCAAAAGVATIRQYHVHTNRLMRNAFELGKESAKATELRRR